MTPTSPTRTRPHSFPYLRALVPIVAGATLFLSGCEGGSDEVEAEKPRDTKEAVSLVGSRVEVVLLQPSAEALSLRVPGEVEGIRDASLASPMGGYIEQVAVDEGDHVKKGAVLARVDSQTYSTRLVRAQVEKEAAERELERTKQLGAAIPRTEIDTAEDRLKSAKAALGELQVAAERSVINAPFSGVVVHSDAEVGEVATPGAPLFRLVQLQPVRVSIALSDQDLRLAQVGMPARVELNARSGVFEGKVVQLSQAASTKTRSFEALVEVENEDETLLPGMIAQVSLSTHSGEGKNDDKLLVSQDWLVTKPSGVGAFVEENGRAVFREVKLGTVVRRQVEVLDGLKAGDRLIVVGHRSLAEGDQVLVHRVGRCCENGRAVFSE